MHDAMIATWDAKYAYNRPRPTEFDSSITAAVAVPRSPSYPSEHAAAAGAAAAMLGFLFPTDAGEFERMAQEAAESRVQAGVQYPSDVAAGLALGRQVAAVAIEHGQTDNSNATWDGVIPTGPGLWTGTNPGGVPEREWKPWVLSSPSQLRPDPPPAYDSDEKAAELAEVKNFPRTPRTTALALSWQYGLYGNSVGIVYWIREASRRIFEEHLDANAPWAAGCTPCSASASTTTGLPRRTRSSPTEPRVRSSLIPPSPRSSRRRITPRIRHTVQDWRPERKCWPTSFHGMRNRSGKRPSRSPSRPSGRGSTSAAISWLGRPSATPWPNSSSTASKTTLDRELGDSRPGPVSGSARGQNGRSAPGGVWARSPDAMVAPAVGCPVGGAARWGRAGAWRRARRGSNPWAARGRTGSAPRQR